MSYHMESRDCNHTEFLETNSVMQRIDHQKKLSVDKFVVFVPQTLTNTAEKSGQSG